jgi:hypothetical protein
MNQPPEFGVYSALSTIIVVSLIGWVFWILLRGLMPRRPVFCPACGASGRPVKKARGSLAVEIMLWLLLIVPGLVYSVWRMTTYRRVCATCGSDAVIPVDSPLARRALDDLRNQRGS